MVIGNVYNLLNSNYTFQDFNLVLFDFTFSILSDVTNHNFIILGSTGGFNFQNEKNLIVPVLRDSIHFIKPL